MRDETRNTNINLNADTLHYDSVYSDLGRRLCMCWLVPVGHSLAILPVFRVGPNRSVFE
jgi:hypothetical protein